METADNPAPGPIESPPASTEPGMMEEIALFPESLASALGFKAGAEKAEKAIKSAADRADKSRVPTSLTSRLMHTANTSLLSIFQPKLTKVEPSLPAAATGFFGGSEAQPLAMYLVADPVARSLNFGSFFAGMRKFKAD